MDNYQKNIIFAAQIWRAVMKQVIDLIENPRIKDVFECYSKASSSEERQKIIDDYKRWFEKL